MPVSLIIVQVSTILIKGFLVFYLFPKQIRPDLKHIGLPSPRSVFSSKPSQLEYFFHYYFEMEKIALIFTYKVKFDFRVLCSALFHLINFSAMRTLSLRI